MSRTAEYVAGRLIGLDLSDGTVYKADFAMHCKQHNSDSAGVRT